MHRRGLHEPDIAVNAAARIPARGIRRIVQADGKDIVPAEIDVRRQVKFATKRSRKASRRRIGR